MITPQTLLVSYGAVGTLVSRFYFHKDWQSSIFFGFATISAIAVLTAHKDEETKKV